MSLMPSFMQPLLHTPALIVFFFTLLPLSLPSKTWLHFPADKVPFTACLLASDQHTYICVCVCVYSLLLKFLHLWKTWFLLCVFTCVSDTGGLETGNTQSLNYNYSWLKWSFLYSLHAVETQTCFCQCVSDLMLWLREHTHVKTSIKTSVGLNTLFGKLLFLLFVSFFYNFFVNKFLIPSLKVNFDLSTCFLDFLVSNLFLVSPYFQCYFLKHL